MTNDKKPRRSAKKKTTKKSAVKKTAAKKKAVKKTMVKKIAKKKVAKKKVAAKKSTLTKKTAKKAITKKRILGNLLIKLPEEKLHHQLLPLKRSLKRRQQKKPSLRNRLLEKTGLKITFQTPRLLSVKSIAIWSTTSSTCLRLSLPLSLFTASLLPNLPLPHL